MCKFKEIYALARKKQNIQIHIFRSFHVHVKGEKPTKTIQPQQKKKKTFARKVPGFP